MRNYIYCTPTAKGIHSFYLVFEGDRYFLFTQNYRKGVHKFYSRGVAIRQAFEIANAHLDAAVIRTMEKLPIYIKKVEKECHIAVLNKTISTLPRRRNAA